MRTEKVQKSDFEQMLFQALDISVVINLSMTCPKSVCIKEEKNFMRIPVNDSYQEKLSPYFPMAYEFLERCRKAGKKCLIHCLAGISRSPTLCISYIMRHMKMGSDDAYRYEFLVCLTSFNLSFYSDTSRNVVHQSPRTSTSWDNS